MAAFVVVSGLAPVRMGRASCSFLGAGMYSDAVRGRRSVSRVRMGFDLPSELIRVHEQLVASTILLADAAASTPAADAVTDSASKPGVWRSFVLLIEKSIQGIHDGLDGAGVPYAYGFSIILFTLLVKLLTLPLGVQQLESTMKMQAAQPKVKQLQNRYRDNPQVMNQQLANLYKEEGINPLAGCLPVLGQTPIWIALYRALLNMSKEDLLTEPFLWVPSLQGPVAQGGSVKDWLFPFVDGAPPIGWHDAISYMILPVILLITQQYSQKVLTPPNPDKATEQTNQILKFLPFMLAWFALTVPSGLTVYWVTNNVLSTAQTVVLRKRFNAANPPAEIEVEIEEAEIRPMKTPLSEADGFQAPSKGSAKKKTKKRRK